MPDLLIRDVPAEVIKALDDKARSAGFTSREKWLVERLEKLARVPESYAYRVIGVVGKGTIKRYSDHVNGVSATFANFGQEEADVMQRAENFIRRNGIGDKEKAYNVLVEQFGEDNVFEVPV